MLGVGLLLLGYFLGGSAGPGAVEFPDPNEARDAAQMERAVAEALAEPRAFPRASRLIRLMEGINAENVEGAVRAVSARVAGGDPVDLQLVLTAWVHLDPHTAIDHVRGWPMRLHREIGIRTVIREWAASGGRIAAAAYFETVTDSDVRAIAAGPLVRGWALAGDNRGALELAHRLWHGEGQRDVVSGLMRGVLHASDTSGALALARSTDPNRRGQFERQLARDTLRLVGRENPVAAAAFYSELEDAAQSDWLAGSLAPLAGSWRNRDPQATLEWLLTRQEDSERLDALTKTIATWGRQDLEEAWAWFEARFGGASAEQDLSTLESTLLAGLLRSMARTHPSDAARWVGRIRAGEDRSALFIRVSYFWSIEDGEAALDWIETLEIPEELRARMLQAAERSRQDTRG
ncbi:MAG: hypothetical protein CL933_06845 [Deltaproteobacteria bacterium]|nr:hypothetical protein [Deltaproteobacteria bacterium]